MFRPAPAPPARGTRQTAARDTSPKVRSRMRTTLTPSPFRVAAMTWVIVLVVVLVILAIAVVAIYNRLVRLRNRTENSWAQVDVQLRRRYDLIPNLVETVKGYAAHEQKTFEEVTKARTAAQQAQGIEQQAAAENALTAAIGRLFAVAEAYPQLRATENFQKLQDELSDTEQKIAVSRQ